jgi:glycosyltransferase involved in cell wall biosynthesis
MPEVAGDAAILVNPDEPVEIIEAIRQTLDDSELRQSLVEKGRERVPQFSWKNTASKTLLVYDLVSET